MPAGDAGTLKIIFALHRLPALRVYWTSKPGKVSHWHPAVRNSLISTNEGATETIMARMNEQTKTKNNRYINR